MIPRRVQAQPQSESAARSLAAMDGEHAMRRDLDELLGEVVVILELRDLFLLAGDDA